MRKKQVTIKDIAKTLGVSHSTISRALSRDKSYMVSEETCRLVRQTAEEINYRPNLLAKGFATGKTGTLGLLAFESYPEPFGTQIDWFLKAADERNYRLLVGMSAERDSETPAVDQVSQIGQFVLRGIDGLLLQTMGDVEESERIRRAVDGRVPVVTFPYPVQDYCGVVLDQMAGFYRATTHLIELGHERIGFLGDDWDESGQESSGGRGYYKAMSEHGLTPKSLAVGLQQAESGYRLSREIKDRFTALVCRSDYTAIGVCRGMRELGIRVPEDVAVVGNGNIDVSAYVTPALTTQSTPANEIAHAAMDLMLRQFEGQNMVWRIVLTSTLVLRDSCGVERACS